MVKCCKRLKFLTFESILIIMFLIISTLHCSGKEPPMKNDTKQTEIQTNISKIFDHCISRFDVLLYYTIAHAQITHCRRSCSDSMAFRNGVYFWMLLWSFLDLLSLIYYAECIYSAVRVYNTISSIGKQPTVTLSTGIFFPMAVEYDRNY